MDKSEQVFDTVGMAWSRAVPDDEIAAELAASLPPDEAEAALARLLGASAPAPRHRPLDLREATARARPIALAGERLLPVAAPFDVVLPAGGLVRGSTMAVTAVSPLGAGATSLTLALVAEASRTGSWVAAVGTPALGLAAAAEAGLALERCATIAAAPAESWATVVAALVGAFDVVLVGEGVRLRAGDARRLVARVRERGTVLVSLGARRRAGIDIDVSLVARHACWSGLGNGSGSLRARRVEVEVGGRGQASRARLVDLWLPDERGRVRLAAPAHEGTSSTAAAVISLERRRLAG